MLYNDILTLLGWSSLDVGQFADVKSALDLLNNFDLSEKSSLLVVGLGLGVSGLLVAGDLGSAGGLGSRLDWLGGLLDNLLWSNSLLWSGSLNWLGIGLLGNALLNGSSWLDRLALGRALGTLLGSNWFGVLDNGWSFWHFFLDKV